MTTAPWDLRVPERPRTLRTNPDAPTMRVADLAIRNPEPAGTDGAWVRSRRSVNTRIPSVRSSTCREKLFAWRLAGVTVMANFHGCNRNGDQAQRPNEGCGAGDGHPGTHEMIRQSHVGKTWRGPRFWGRPSDRPRADLSSQDSAVRTSAGSATLNSLEGQGRLLICVRMPETLFAHRLPAQAGFGTTRRARAGGCGAQRSSRC